MSYKYLAQFSEHRDDWWHTLPGSYLETGDEQVARDYYRPFLAELRRQVPEGTVVRVVREPLEEVETMPW